MKLETRILTLLVSLLIFSVPSIVSGANIPSVSSTAIAWEAAPGYRLTLNVSRVGRFDFESGEAPRLGLHDIQGRLLVDGTYTWQLTAAGPQGYTESGSFSIVAGAFVDPTLVEGSAEKDQWIGDDMVVQGSACFGCPKYEPFGSDTLRLKSEDPRIRFQDTSSTLEYPSTDWQLTANEPDNGGLDKLSIEDLDAATIPFTVEGGAPDHTVYGQADGDIGIGTNDPQRLLHLTFGDTTSLRLEQDGSMGLPAKTWGLRGNEQNFIIVDVDNAFSEPFIIETQAPASSMHVGLGGHVGVGTEDPKRPIHIVADDSAYIAFEHGASSHRWDVGADSDAFVVSVAESGGSELEIEETGDIYFRHGAQQLAWLDGNGHMSLTGEVTTGGTACGGGCDAVFQPGYDLETIEEHAAFMWENSYLPAVGPTVENGTSWNLTEMTGGMLNELEKAHIYIEQLHGKLRDKRSAIRELSEQLTRLEALAAVK